ncbi:SNF2-related protein [Aquabacterium sp.]|uniref:SNF2-related protein n=1 Tax=Aquabacterium sp. TaxID=1872578 RepID=UPI0039C87282
MNFSWTLGQSLSMRSTCSCPMAHRCKHVVATLITAVTQEWVDSVSTAPAPAAPSTPVYPKEHELLDRWLRTQDLARRQRTTPSQPAEPQRLIYVISTQAHTAHGPDLRLPESGQAHWLCLWPAKTKPLKAKPGQWSKPVLLRGDYGRLFSESEGEGEVFKLLRRWLLGQTNSGYSFADRLPGPTNAVQDAIGLQVLQQVLQTGQAVTLNAQGYIDQTWQWGAPRVLNWSWQSLPLRPGDTTPRWQTLPEIGSEQSVLCLAHPAVYMDHLTQTMGLVQSAQSREQLIDWLRLPPLPEDWMRQHVPELLSLTPPLPTPVVGDLARVVQNVAPQAHLRIGQAPESAPGWLALHLSFDYAGIEGIWALDAPAEQWLDLPEGRVLLHRDIEAERRWLHPLLELGYEPDLPLDRAPPALWLGRRSAGDPHGVLARARDQALLAEGVQHLRGEGFIIRFEPDLSARMRSVETLDLGLDGLAADGSVLDDDDSASARWFSLSLGFEVDGQRINLLPWLPQLLDHLAHASPTDPQDDRLWLHAEPDQWWHVPMTPLRPWLAAMLELVGERPGELAKGHLPLSRYEAMRLATTDAPGHGLSLSGAKAQSLSGMVQSLKAGGLQQEVIIPEGLNAQLRPYQQQGLNWLQFLAHHQLGGVLADDMGLGKTLQTIAHLWVEKQAGRLTLPALVIAPTSLVSNWRNELQRFAPGLRTLVLHGAQRSEQFDDITHSDVVVTTYPLLARDEATLLKRVWSVVVLDEAQTIKNARTQAAGIVQALDARQRLCLSGTPMENHLGEIWSLFHFLMPGYLGTETRFKQLFRTPIEKQGDPERLAILRHRLAPFMLRRTKELVASELPPKIETVEHVQLLPAQAKLYETIRLATEKKVREALSSKGLARSHITVLDALLKLRQVCCHPRLVPLTAASKVKQSAKLNWLIDNLPEMIAEGRRVLLFSQFTSMLELIEEALPALGLHWVTLTGQSTGREALIERFTRGEVPLFLISLKAGGVGLNLPQADTVIHFDPWWNPAVEDQATDRAHRLGQTQTVFVYKLVAEGTLEERILALQERKAELARGLHGDAGTQAAALTESDLDWLLQPLGAGLSAQDPAHSRP